MRDRAIKHSLIPALLLLAFAPGARAAGTFADADARVADIDWFITQIETHYAYLPERRG